MSSATDNDPRRSESSYTEYLPSFFSRGETGRFLRRYLLAFEHILSGLGTVRLDDEGKPQQVPEDATVTGLEEIIQGVTDAGGKELAGVHRFFAPGPELPLEKRAPPEFLNWLAGCVALSFRAGLDEGRWRRFIDRAADLYRVRGTKSSILQLIKIYTGQAATIEEESLAFQIGWSTLEADEHTDQVRRGKWSTSRIGGLPHFFIVSAQLDEGELETQNDHRKVIARIIEMEKPAHTIAALEITGTISMRIGDRDLIITPEDRDKLHATVGKDTIIISDTSVR